MKSMLMRMDVATVPRLWQLQGYNTLPNTIETGDEPLWLGPKDYRTQTPVYGVQNGYLVFELSVEGKMVLWFPIWYLVPPEPVHCGLQVTWPQPLDVADVWGTQDKETGERMTVAIGIDTHTSGKTIVQWLHSSLEQSYSSTTTCSDWTNGQH